VRADHLVLKSLEEELSPAAGAKGLIRVIPSRRLAATGVVRGPKLCQRRTTGASRHDDLAQSVPTEIAVKLSANSHVDLQRNTRNNSPRAFLVPNTPQDPFSFR
jgi:hypothetical protein